MSEQDLFIRRVYTHKGISVVVDIDLVKKTVTMMERKGGQFKTKNWVFAERTREYLGGWVAILDAMKHATTEADKVLKAAEDRDTEEFAKLLMAINDPVLKKPKKND